MHRLLRDLFYFKPSSEQTSLAEALRLLGGVIKKRSAVFVLSDFIDSSDYESSLKLLSKKHDVTALVVRDSLESQLPQLGLMDLEDPETGEIYTVDSSSPILQREFKEAMQEQNKAFNQKLERSQVKYVEVNSSQDYVAPLIKFFRQRGRK